MISASVTNEGSVLLLQKQRSLLFQVQVHLLLLTLP